MTDKKSPEKNHSRHAIINIILLIWTVVSPLFLLSPHFIKIGFIGCLTGAFIGITSRKPDWLLHSSFALSCFANFLLVVAFCRSPAIIIMTEAILLFVTIKLKSDKYYDILNFNNSVLGVITLVAMPELSTFMVIAPIYYIITAILSLLALAPAKSDTSLRLTYYPSGQPDSSEFVPSHSYASYNSWYKPEIDLLEGKDRDYPKPTHNTVDSSSYHSILTGTSTSWDRSSSITNSGGLFGDSSSSTINFGGLFGGDSFSSKIDTGGLFSGGSLGNWRNFT